MFLKEKEAQEMFGYLEQTPKVEEIKKVVKQKKANKNNIMNWKTKKRVQDKIKR